jgi:hypothetical protein
MNNRAKALLILAVAAVSGIAWHISPSARGSQYADSGLPRTDPAENPADSSDSADNSASEPSASIQVPDNPPLPDLAEEAQGRKYDKVTAENLGALLRAIPAESLGTVPQDQIDAFYITLQDNILAYVIGDGQSLLANVLCAPYTINEEVLKWDRYHPFSLKGWTPPPDVTIPTEPDEIMRRSLLDFFAVESKGYYSAISTEASSIIFQASATVPPSAIGEIKEQYELGLRPGGVTQPLAHVTYVDSPSKIAEKFGSLTCVDLKLAVQEEEGGPAIRLKRYYFSPDDGKWLALEALSTVEIGRSVSAREFM